MPLQLGTAFARIALGDPLSALLLLVGAAIIGVTVLAGGYLGLGALFELVTATSR